MLLQDNPGICGGNGIKTDLYRHAYIITSTVHRDTYSYRKVRTEVEINFANLEQAAL